jgi:mono/diheme cytochrome c family protein
MAANGHATDGSSSRRASPIRAAGALLGCAVLLAWLASVSVRGQAAGQPKTQTASGSEAKEVTYTRDVAPILYNKCALCHHANDIAPMSLMSYKEVRPWAAAIREAVVLRKMPPWHADPEVGEFSNDPRLSDAEIEAIRAWVNGGAKEGDPKDMPPAPVFQQGWHIRLDGPSCDPVIHNSRSSNCFTTAGDASRYRSSRRSYFLGKNS